MEYATTEIALRLRASRLAAGITSGSEASAKLGIAPATYRGAETCRRPASRSLLGRAHRVFGVTIDYLIHGAVQTNLDETAREIEAVLRRAREQDWKSDTTLSARLTRARRARGFRSATAAAKANDWKLATYTAHESGTQRIPLDRAIAYALRFRTDLSFLVFGDEPPFRSDDRLASSETSSMVRRPAGPHDLRQPFAVAGDGWAWLPQRPRRIGADISLPLVEQTEAGLRLAGEVPLYGLLGFLTRPGLEEKQLYAVVLSRDEISMEVQIVERLHEPPATLRLLASEGNRARLVLASNPGLVYADPLTAIGSAEHPVVLGLPIGSIELRSFA